tara:strand:+ start:6520 stop:7296 length:777 start_codon:yes stop_codon:yes gene_type:complete
MAVQTKNTGYSIIFPKLERKKRIFLLKGNKTPIRHMINVKHTSSKPLTYFDGQLNRALRWATNQISPFVDEQDGIATIEPITFKDGKLIVEDFNLNLQKFLLMHPEFNKKFYEFDPEKNAQDDVETMVSSLDAQVAAKDMDINDLEAIARVVLKNKNLISRMTSSELRRDMIIWARNNSSEFMDLLNDENLKLRNIAVRAVEMNVLHVKSDNRTVVWGDNKKEKIIVVPYGENVYSALAVYFKTDEGLDVLQNITNKL